MYLRHAGSVALSFLNSNVFTPCRLGRHVVYPSALFSSTAFLLLEKSSFNLTYHFRPTRRGCFFRAKAQKKSTPDGAAKACLHDSRNTNHFGWVGQVCLKGK
jgi:hypothetical protein